MKIGQQTHLKIKTVLLFEVSKIYVNLNDSNTIKRQNIVQFNHLILCYNFVNSSFTLAQSVVTIY